MQTRAVLFMTLAFIAGSLMPIQAGVNHRLARGVSNSITASFVSFCVGLVALAIYLAVTKKFQLDTAAIKSEPAWIWIGGLFGAVFVASTTLLVPKLGATLTFSLVIFGQLFMSLLVDHYGWLGVPVNPITLKKFIGVTLVVAGVLIIRKS